MYVVDYMVNYDIPVGDLVKISSYGENHKGKVVMVDYGFTEHIYNTHYRR